jgi:glycosyltransferase involved in cell wall biosynthesis
VTLNIFQDLATPHNNVLIKALKARPDMLVKTWYAYETMPGYPQAICYAHDLGRSEIFGGERPNLKALRYWLTHPDEKYLLVGWSNPTQRWLMLLSWALGRDFAYWTDHPKDKPDRGQANQAAHRIFLRILAKRARPFFAVGQHTIEYFAGRGVPRENMVNLPIFVEVPQDLAAVRAGAMAIRQRHGVQTGEVFLVAGSRLLWEKGYDVLIEALAMLEPPLAQRFRLLLVGSGPEETKLKALINDRRLADRCTMIGWLAAAEFMDVIASADVFVHPARFDAWGGGTLHAMALSVPVIGSCGAGAANDRVEHGTSGLIYQNDDPALLRDCLRQVLENPHMLKPMGAKARDTAERWAPANGAEIVRRTITR